MLNMMRNDDYDVDDDDEFDDNDDEEEDEDDVGDDDSFDDDESNENENRELKQRRRRRLRHALHVRFTLVNISMPFSLWQQRELTKWGREHLTINLQFSLKISILLSPILVVECWHSLSMLSYLE